LASTEFKVNVGGKSVFLTSSPANTWQDAVDACKQYDGLSTITSLQGFSPEDVEQLRLFLGQHLVDGAFVIDNQYMIISFNNLILVISIYCY
jgi:hypothetical protein